MAIIFGLVRLLAIASNLNSTGELLAMVAMASIVVGTIQGLAQTNIKRLLSYSSINHVGFILIGLLAGIPFIGAGFFYVIVYILMTIAMFSILFSLKVSQRNTTVDKPYYLINNLTHLGYRQPLLAFSLAIILFSMAGVPPLIGFFSKFYVLYNAIQTNFYILAFIGILGSAIAAVYYIKLIQLMFFNAVTVKSNNQLIVNYEISFTSALVISTLLFILMFSFTKLELLLYLTAI
jgi:NADH:ubiquinone oxidoreductase subunit 2 (subunit N)